MRFAMFQKEKMEDKIKRTELQMRKMAIQIEQMEREYQSIVTELGATAEQVQTFIENPENFSAPIWEILQKEKKALENKTSLSLSTVKDTRALEKSYASLGAVESRWIYVK